MSELLDQFHAEAAESDRAWTPEEIASRVLRMKPGAGTPFLVRAVLAADGRFQERADGSWEVQRTPRTPLVDEPYRLCWFEAGEGEALRIHLALWTKGRSCGPPIEIDGADPSRWFSRAGELLGERWATLQPAVCARWLWRMDRRWAFGESACAPLDLLTWSRIALLDEGLEAPDLRREGSPERLAARWGFGGHADDGPGRIRLLGQILDHLSELYPEWAEPEFERARIERLESRPLDWSRFQFPRASLDDLPARPGVYRLRGEGDDLVYVGKALDLGRRLQEHFRPFPPEQTKREEMLAEVRRFEFEELPSELEALVREHRAIVEEGPRWNVQVEVHPPKRFPADWTWPLIYVAPGPGPVRTVVMLTGVDRGALFQLDPSRPERPGLSDILGHLSEDGSVEEALPGDDDGTLLLLEPAEARLALRYFVRFRDRIDRVDPLVGLSPEDLSGRVCELAECVTESYPRELRG